MSDKKYSIDEELYNFSEIEEAAEAVFDYPAAKIGDIRSVYSCDPYMFKASEFAPDIVDDMRERAYEECGEWGEDFLMSSSLDNDNELTKKLEDVVDEWANSHGLQPTFYRVDNVKEIQIKLIDNDGNFEALAELKR